MQLSFTLLLCLIDLKAEQKERDNRVVMHDSRPMGARHSWRIGAQNPRGYRYLTKAWGLDDHLYHSVGL
jgi:hypothetical protein